LYDITQEWVFAMRYIAGLIIIVLIFVIGIALIFGGHKKGTKTPQPVPKTLPEYASTDARVSFTVDGSITGDDTKRAIWIIIGKDQRTLEVVQGYNGHVIQTNTQPNNQAAYSAFLKSIYNAGFTFQRKGTKLTADYSVICPLQNRYIFSLQQGNQSISQLWTSDCGIATGDFGGDFDSIQALFQLQITGYNDLVSNVVLNP